MAQEIEVRKVKDLEASGKDYVLIDFLNNPIELEFLHEYLGLEDNYNFLFVLVVDGDFDEVWGGFDRMPLVDSEVYRLV